MAYVPFDYTSRGQSDDRDAAAFSGRSTIVGALMALMVMFLILAAARVAYDRWLAGPAEEIAREAIAASNNVVLTSSH